MLRCGRTTVDPHFVCTIECGAELSCGHRCLKSCSCCDQWGHGCCTNPCGRSYRTCMHECEAACHGDEPCPPCKEPCLLQCAHATCDKFCHEPCSPCTEPCITGCVHEGFCTRPCAVPCDVLPCSRRCEKSLACGHRCPSGCGESCPDWAYCQTCANTTIKETVVNRIQGLTYQEIELEYNPIQVLACSHLRDTISMDAYMDASAGFDVTDHLFSPCLPSDSLPLLVESINGWQICHYPLSGIHRYNRLLKRAQLDQSTKRFVILANAQFVPLTSALQLEERALKNANVRLREKAATKFVHPFLPTRVRIGGPREVQLHNISQFSGLDSRYEGACGLRTAIYTCLWKVGDKKRPFEQVWAGQAAEINVAGTVLQTRNRLLAEHLLLRCEYAILADIVKIHHAQKNRPSTEHEWLTRDLSLNFHFNRMECLKVGPSRKAKTAADNRSGRPSPLCDICSTGKHGTSANEPSNADPG